MKITPALVPHTDFHRGRWLLPVNRREWYYFMKRKSRNDISNKKFLKSVDKPLRKLVKWLHQKGIKTTPSCAGHHMSERNLEIIYADLEKDRDEIRNGGLPLKDVETGQLYLYKDNHYNLPWSKQDFLEKVVVYQQNGVLGLRLGHRKKAKEKILKIFKNFPSNGITVKARDSVVFIFTMEYNQNTWKRITRVLKSVLKDY